MNLGWLVEDWRTLWPSPWSYMALSLAAILCGILMGGERQHREKPAGLRTLCLVCLGSAVFTMVSFAFSTTTHDSGRVAAQVVTGIGFLGAGAILHGRQTVTGMTTAGTIWMTAAIGMTVGAGYGLAGLMLSLLVNRMLIVFFLYETRWHPDLRHVTVKIEFAPEGGLTRVKLERVLVDYNLVGARAEWHSLADNRERLTLHIRLARVHLCELLAQVAELPAIHSLQQTDIHPS